MTLAEVRLWGTTIGAVGWNDNTACAEFEYTREMLASHIEVAPLTMPLSPEVYTFPALRGESFHGLPGLLGDSLPDDFGNALINAWLAREGRDIASFNPVERLCYTGSRGMGALEYRPALGPSPGPAAPLDVAALVELASAILSHRGQLTSCFDSKHSTEAITEILRVGTSAGGARAKAIIAWNPTTGEVRSGQLPAQQGFSHWLLKFDGVSGNRDKELNDPVGYGLIEYAYHNMAVAVGITMMDCRLLSENGRNHFMTKRFDRTSTGGKLHMQSLGAMAHLDYRQPGAHSYEQALRLVRQLGMSMDAIEELFRRMAFNIVARNQDDHVKNIAFLMNKRGTWSLAPAYDVTYSYNPHGAWTGQHQMSLNGKRDNFTLADFKACAKLVSMMRGRAQTILEQVTRTVRSWPDFANKAGVPERLAATIATHHRTNLV